LFLGFHQLTLIWFDCDSLMMVLTDFAKVISVASSGFPLHPER
jgi:hypothetical protein